MPRVLVVEDDPMIREVITRRLSAEGYEISTAVDGMQAVRQARIERPQLIIMDMGLPNLNGWQATHRIRLMPMTQHIPIIALTAFVLKEDRARSFMAGCNDYETKPVDFDRLLGKMERLLSGSPGERQNLALALSSGAEA